MRAIWKGAVAFGLVNVPVKLYAATGEHSVPLHQVHREDGGRIRYRKTCSVCGEDVAYEDIAKGYQTDDGRMVVLTDEDLAELPLATEREIAVEEFVPVEQVDPIMLGTTYYLEPDKTAAKPYALLREALKTTDRMAVVKVALRQRESMAVLRVRGDVICLQTLLWPDEIRAADFPILEADVAVRPQELTMAASLVESLAADFDPSAFEDSYQAALEAMIEAKVSSGTTVQMAPTRDEVEEEGGQVVDLLSALQRSVEKARDARAASGKPTTTATTDVELKAQAEVAAGEKAASRRTGTRAASSKASAAPKAPASKAPASKAPASKTAASKTAASKTAASKVTSKGAAAKTAATTVRSRKPAAATTSAESAAKKAPARRRAS